MDTEKWFNLVAEIFSSEVLIRFSLFCMLVFGIALAWRLQRTINNGLDFADFIKDPNTQKFTTERLGHFVALWVTTVAFCFLLTVESVNKVDLFLTYGGLWVTSRALDKFASRINNGESRYERGSRRNSWLEDKMKREEEQDGIRRRND